MGGAASAIGRAEITIARLMGHACVITSPIRVTPCVSGRSSRLSTLQTAGDVPGVRVADSGTRVSVCAACPAL
jgi:hypothetical protein